MRGDKEITNSADIIDSRDIIDRISYLEDERQTLVDNREEAQEDLKPSNEEQSASREDEQDPELAAALSRAEDALIEWDDSDEGQELKALKALAEEGEGYSDWKHGAALIRDSYFKDYAMQTAEDIGCVDEAARWPATCIDWDQAADELKQDYSMIDFDGVEYWIR